jgi:hypothetical protein
MQHEIGGAVPQTAVILVVIRHYASMVPNFTVHSSEDSQANATGNAGLSTSNITNRKGMFQYRLASACPVRRNTPKRW